MQYIIYPKPCHGRISTHNMSTVNQDILKETLAFNPDDALWENAPGAATSSSSETPGCRRADASSRNKPACHCQAEARRCPVRRNCRYLQSPRVRGRRSDCCMAHRPDIQLDTPAAARMQSSSCQTEHIRFEPRHDRDVPCES